LVSSGRVETRYWCDAQKRLDFAFARPYNVFCAVQQYRQPKTAGTDRQTGKSAPKDFAR
jgi:hypothetical protein